MKKYLSFSFMILFAMFALTVISCSKDDNNPGGSNGEGVLTVNGVKWTSTNLPNYEGDNFHFIGKSPSGEYHTVVFNESLEDVEPGEDITPYYVFFPTENADYEYVDGDVIVTKTNYPKSVTVKFDNYTIEYIGKYLSGGGDSRWPDIQDDDRLVIKGTMTFFSY